MVVVLLERCHLRVVFAQVTQILRVVFNYHLVLLSFHHLNSEFLVRLIVLASSCMLRPGRWAFLVAAAFKV